MQTVLRHNEDKLGALRELTKLNGSDGNAEAIDDFLVKFSKAQQSGQPDRRLKTPNFRVNTPEGLQYASSQPLAPPPMQRSFSAQSQGPSASMGGRPPLPGGSPMATRRAPSPLLRTGSFGGTATLPFPSSASGEPRRGEDSLDAEMRRATPTLPTSSGSHPRGSGRLSGTGGGADVFVVNPSSSRPATGASGIGPSGSFLTADPPPAGSRSASRPASGSALPQFGRRASGAGGYPMQSGGATPLDMSLGLSMDGESALVMPHHHQGL